MSYQHEILMDTFWRALYNTLLSGIPGCIQTSSHISSLAEYVSDNNGKKEPQLMLTNPRDAFRGQSTSPNS